ncbi:hypothetical protein LXA47_24290 [Massilia sp. P8910]|uniref:Uncharacterized protein n=1 Tax=Massilia frigida TaxID=2609281 RepID=A0ABX0NIY7_9BURK|nr:MULTISPECIES: hypothetical protein [Massilia]MCE3606697.1 hypothetical protein [Massilia antarctica]MCY0914975.1 hypothetical protein [Massilia sp. H27-R4]MDM5176175.1 hypothetical protein [Massilia sp. DJPM01]NHZ83706.1 hypothetical protein [Massilia frigida]
MDQHLQMEKLRDTFMSACDLIGEGNYEAALEALVWIHDNPIPDLLPSEMFRRIYGFQTWGILASRYPAAKQKMEELLARKIEAAEKGGASTSIRADIGRMREILASYLFTSPE